MREHNGGDSVLPLQQVADVGQHQVDADHLVFREHEPAVDDDDRVVVLDGRHILADGPDAAEGNDLYGSSHYVSSISLEVEGTSREARRSPVVALIVGDCGA